MTTYPLALPTHTGIRGIEFRAVNSVAYERSPFTFAGQAQANAGQMWMADVTLPPMKYSDAEQWTAWLISLRGQFGTFTMGDPMRCVARGSARGTDSVTVNNGSSIAATSIVVGSTYEILTIGTTDFTAVGAESNSIGVIFTATAVGTGTGTVTASQTGQVINITSDQLSQTGYLKAGDYIQLGSGSSATLHKVLTDVNTDGGGDAALTLWPHIRNAPADGSAVVVQNAVGLFRLASNETSWSVNEASIYGISFSAMEAV